MIKLIYEPEDDVKDFTVDRIEMTSTEDGGIQSYLKAFDAFLRACGFMQGTIEEALPTYEL